MQGVLIGGHLLEDAPLEVPDHDFAVRRGRHDVLARAGHAQAGYVLKGPLGTQGALNLSESCTENTWNSIFWLVLTTGVTQNSETLFCQSSKHYSNVP